MRIGRPLAAWLALGALSGALHADTLDVPATYATIQAAITDASDGDTVLVAPGTYVETIDYLGKAITVESSGGAAVTTIDGSGGRTVVSFVTGEKNDSVLRGFTVTGGTGTLMAEPLSPLTLRGGGVLALGTAPSIEDCVITQNSAARGGGVYVKGNLITTPARLLDSTLSQNSAWTGAGFEAFEGSLLVERCLITGNMATGSGGGGAFRDSNEGQFAAWWLTIEDTTISGNLAAGTGGGLFVSIASDILPGGAAFLDRCRVTDNFAVARGGGLSLSAVGLSASANVRNSVIARNSAGLEGGGVDRAGSGLTRFCTITENTAPVGAGLSSANPSVDHCIVWGNHGEEIGGVMSSVLWCDVGGGYPGTGTFDFDPLFADAPNGDYHLQDTSACQDAGNPADLGAGTDIDGDARLLGAIVDVGADEATFPKSPWTNLGHSLSGLDPARILTGSGTLLPGATTTLSLGPIAFPGGTPTYHLVIGTSYLGVPFKGGVMVPKPDVIVMKLNPFGAGVLVLSGPWPPTIPTGFTIYFQYWMNNTFTCCGYAVSNALSATTP